MITRNMKIFQKIALTARNNSYDVPNMVAIDDSVTTSVYAAPASYSGRFLLTTVDNNALYGVVMTGGSGCIWVGTDDTPNTEVAGTDYCSDNKLKAPCSTSDITSNSFAISPAQSQWDADLNVSFMLTRKFTANTDLVIKEIGFLKSCEKQYLLERIVLPQENWISVASGDTFTINYVIKV